MLAWLLLACGGEPPPAPSPSSTDQSVLQALEQLQAPPPASGGSAPAPGAAPAPSAGAAPAPSAGAAPGARAAPRSPPASRQPATERPVSPACEQAREERARARARVNAHMEKVVAPAEDRWLRAREALDACLADARGCAADGPRLQELHVAWKKAEAAYERAADLQARKEAELLPYEQAVARACMGRR